MVMVQAPGAYAIVKTFLELSLDLALFVKARRDEKESGSYDLLSLVR